jgi:hypothetical protein
VYLLVFLAYINKMHGSRSKILSKKSCPYIYDIKFLALLGAPYIYDISRLRVNLVVRCGWVPNATPWPLYPLETQGTHCIGGWVDPSVGLDGCGKSSPTGIRFPDLPACSESLYRLSYPGPRSRCYDKQSVSFRFSYQIVVCFSLLPYTCYIYSPFYFTF